MRILLIGDLHNEEEHIPHPFIPQEVIKSVDLIIQTGDCHYAEEAIDWLAEFDKPVFFIPGNHEYWNVEDWHSHNLWEYQFGTRFQSKRHQNRDFA